MENPKTVSETPPIDIMHVAVHRMWAARQACEMAAMMNTSPQAMVVWEEALLEQSLAADDLYRVHLLIKEFMEVENAVQESGSASLF